MFLVIMLLGLAHTMRSGADTYEAGDGYIMTSKYGVPTFTGISSMIYNEEVLYWMNRIREAHAGEDFIF